MPGKDEKFMTLSKEFKKLKECTIQCMPVRIVTAPYDIKAYDNGQS